MTDNTISEQAPEQVSLTLKIDANVYEAFLRKAKQANMEVEDFLSSTLTIVLGCRVFNEKYSCSPAKFVKNPTANNDPCEKAA